MNSLLKLQLNTPTSFTRDMTVELTHQVTGEKKKVTPYLDGSISVPNLESGAWRVQVKHPNLLFDLYDRPIKVFPDRPTITPISIPANLFENVPIRDVPDADLSPVQQRADEAVGAAERQARKQAGQPIYADDWNDLAGTTGTVARALRELTDLVSPRGHDHPEIAEKLDEVQRNLQRLLDAMGSSLAQLQRQFQQLALERKIDVALDRVPATTPALRESLQATAKELAEVYAESPGVYSARKRQTAQKLQEHLGTLLADQNPEIRNAAEVKDLDTFTRAMATEKPAASYEEELQQQQRTGAKSATGLIFDAFKAGRTSGG